MRMHRKARYFDIYVELPKQISLGAFINDIRSKDILVEDLQMESANTIDNNARGFIMTLYTKKRIERADLAAILQEIVVDLHIDIF